MLHGAAANHSGRIDTVPCVRVAADLCFGKIPRPGIVRSPPYKEIVGKAAEAAGKPRHRS